MKIAHVSDTHGTFPRITEDVDLIVHSGDIVPNIRRADRSADASSEWALPTEELVFQTNWIHEHGDMLYNWCGELPLVVIPGNHDFFPMGVLSDVLPHVYDIFMTRIEINGVVFAGFPYVPHIAGEWNYEMRSPEMQSQIERFRTLGWNHDKLCDVLVAHCPPDGALAKDPSGVKHGNRQLANLLTYGLETMPKAVLCGHFHESTGEVDFDGCRIINSATTVTYLEV